MLLSRTARQAGIRGTLPLSRKLSIAAASQGFARPAYRLGTNPILGVSASRSLSLWPSWGSPKPTTAPTQPSPDTTTPEPVESVAGVDAPISPPIEVTQVEPNVVSPDVVSTTLDSLSSSPAAHQLGDFAANGFGGAWPSGWVQTGLELLHVQTGLPWWASIFILTAVVRTALLPLNLKLVGNASRLARVQPQLAVLTEQIKRARDAGDSAALQHAGFRAQKLLESAGANPFKGLLGPLVQMPVALSFFFGIRNLCNAGLPTLKDGGVGWFTDLTLADPTWALPILSSASMLILLETSAIDAQAGAAGHTRNFFRVLSLITIPIVSYLPSGVLVYFVANGVFMLIQNTLVKIPAVRKRYNIVDKATPPPGANVAKPPTFADSLRALRDGVKDAASKAREQQEAEARARARANPGKRN
ncbi:Mitochondrial inner membrane protein OXA1L OS=Mus musculus GN=Oxa1l PE=2 SV=1 [Rhizoctonia solani AG-1 IB]|uniref:Mitochondrial inner membrane protein OXA1L n=1 Tax=Thanatephorus cucumeris (strain AG1-IB / isolate 7/3/14) TaxID=1108050 RepID=A0A0B7F927_THACB|nr:Mitochondrial inner membrane protein OXA1L OS=Mus musculus GN=Oxa1l PE=2 SV=1 [Rhizoctonia solani AG-1 IB]